VTEIVAGTRPLASRESSEAHKQSASFDRKLIRYRNRCGVDQAADTAKSAVTLHNFRAQFSSALRATQDTAVAATILGHWKVGVTDIAYAKFPMERLRQAVESVTLPAGVNPPA
jgi:integrase